MSPDAVTRCPRDGDFPRRTSSCASASPRIGFASTGRYGRISSSILTFVPVWSAAPFAMSSNIATISFRASISAARRPKSPTAREGMMFEATPPSRMMPCTRAVDGRCCRQPSTATKSAMRAVSALRPFSGETAAWDAKPSKMTRFTEIPRSLSLTLQ